MIVILLHLKVKDADFIFRKFRGVARSDIHIWCANDDDYYKHLKYLGHDIQIHIGDVEKMMNFHKRHFHHSTQHLSYIITSK